MSVLSVDRSIDRSTGKGEDEKEHRKMKFDRREQLSIRKIRCSRPIDFIEKRKTKMKKMRFCHSISTHGFR